jgi:hypothetical protein
MYLKSVLAKGLLQRTDGQTEVQISVLEWCMVCIPVKINR